MNYKLKFAQNLKILIGERSVTSVAKDIGIPHQTLQRYLHAEREIGMLNLIRIAEFFDESIDSIVGYREW